MSSGRVNVTCRVAYSGVSVITRVDEGAGAVETATSG